MRIPSVAPARRPRARRVCVLLPLTLLAFVTACSRSETKPPEIRFSTIPPDPQAGDVHMVFAVTIERAPLRGKTVDVTASLPPRPPLPSMEVTAAATEDRPGQYGTVATLAARGKWSIAATVRDGERVLAERTFTLDVR
jgi:hypothetical protein